jgi:hypothetical protein
MVNCRKQGTWSGDFCLVLPPEADHEYFQSRGIYTLADAEPTYYKKFAIFDEYFLQQEITKWGTPWDKWEICLYLDVDVLVQSPLEPLLAEYEHGTILAVREPFDLYHAFTNWATPELLNSQEYADGCRWLWQHYDPTWKQYNTGIMLYQLRTLPSNLRQELRWMRDRLAPINTHVERGTDQPIINLVCQKLFRSVRSRLYCYWNEAGPETRIIHTNSGYAPWIEKSPDMNAYFNEYLGRPCYDIYQENLASFEETFPVQT